MSHRHTRQRNNICVDCGAVLCTHHLANLRGCLLDHGHEGPHFNLHARDLRAWNDDEGMYINSKEDWIKLVDLLGKQDSPFKDSCSNRSLEESLEKREADLDFMNNPPTRH